MKGKKKYIAAALAAVLFLGMVVWMLHLQFSGEELRPLYTSPQGELVPFTTERVEEKWEAAGFSAESSKALTEEARERMEESGRAMIFTESYIEDDNGFSPLVPEELPEELAREGKDLPGVLTLHTAVYQFATKPDVPACLVVSRFMWERLPRYAGTDAVGLNRDVYSTAEVPGYIHCDSLYWERQGGGAAPHSTVDEKGAGESFPTLPFMSADAPKRSWGQDVSGWEGGVQFAVALKNGAYLPQSYALQVSFLHQVGAGFPPEAVAYHSPSDGFFRAEGRCAAIYQRISLVFGVDGWLC